MREHNNATPNKILFLYLLNLKLTRRNRIEIARVEVKKYFPGSVNLAITIPEHNGMQIRKRGISLFSTVSSE
jgi:hypothetical protein